MDRRVRSNDQANLEIAVDSFPPVGVKTGGQRGPYWMKCARSGRVQSHGAYFRQAGGRLHAQIENKITNTETASRGVERARKFPQLLGATATPGLARIRGTGRDGLRGCNKGIFKNSPCMNSTNSFTLRDSSRAEG